MANIAILGFGVVGGGIACVIDENREKIKRSVCEDVVVKYILDLREFPDSPYADRVIHDITPILEDESVSVVCECMGGTKPALDFSLRALRAGKSVVTSNKELVAKHGDELLRTAKENGVCYLYEAAVGGGIPVLRSMKTSLASEKIIRITGILNGTTNYILTQMKNEGGSFADALSQAQSLGYAEADPTADVDGFDAQRKIMILAAIAMGRLVPESAVQAETMRNVTEADLVTAETFGGALRLIGFFDGSDRPCLGVAPFIVLNENILAHVDDVYNAVHVEGEVTGDVAYYGRGAGRYPTAGAMVSDVCAAVSGAGKLEQPDLWERLDESETRPFGDMKFRRAIRLEGDDTRNAMSVLETRITLSSCAIEDGTVRVVTKDAVTNAELEAALADLGCETFALRILE